MNLQNPKYCFKDGKIYNRQSGEVIPDDEPVMVFRARDRHAIDVIIYYLSIINNVEHKIAVSRIVGDFAQFAIKHDDRMKEPDTQLNLFD